MTRPRRPPRRRTPPPPATPPPRRQPNTGDPARQQKEYERTPAGGGFRVLRKPRLIDEE